MQRRPPLFCIQWSLASLPRPCQAWHLAIQGYPWDGSLLLGLWALPVCARANVLRL